MKKIIFAALAAMAIFTLIGANNPDEKMEKNGTWRIDNAEIRHNQNPDTFEIPSEKERNALQPGDFAKIILLSEDGGERIWIRITERTPNGFKGTLDNEPILISGLDFGDEIEFAPENIIDFMQ